MAPFEPIISSIDIYTTQCIDKYNYNDLTNDTKLKALRTGLYGDSNPPQGKWTLRLPKPNDLNEELKNAEFYLCESVSFNDIKDSSLIGRFVKKTLSLKNIVTKLALSSFQGSHNRLFSDVKYQYNSRVFHAGIRTKLYEGFDNCLDLPCDGNTTFLYQNGFETLKVGDYLAKSRPLNWST